MLFRCVIGAICKITAAVVTIKVFNGSEFANFLSSYYL
jgi:hypothetical protein